MKMKLPQTSSAAVIIGGLLIVMFHIYSLPPCAFAQAGSSAPDAATVLILRHADKKVQTGDAPPLNEAGKARAEELCHVAGSAGVAAIYVTPTTRARETAQPLAQRLGLTPTEYKDIIALSKEVPEKYRGKVVLIVSHSGEVQRGIREMTGKDVSHMSSDYDNLFVVTAYGGGAGNFIWLRYGKSFGASPCPPR
jgi:broad specificity phosphatase PhoE